LSVTRCAAECRRAGAYSVGAALAKLVVRACTKPWSEGEPRRGRLVTAADALVLMQRGLLGAAFGPIGDRIRGGCASPSVAPTAKPRQSGALLRAACMLRSWRGLRVTCKSGRAPQRHKVAAHQQISRRWDLIELADRNPRSVIVLAFHKPPLLQ